MTAVPWLQPRPKFILILISCLISGENRAEPEAEEPAQKKRREQLDYIQSEEFQHILNAKSANSWIMGEVSVCMCVE